MNKLLMVSVWMLLVGCAQKRVSDSLAEATLVEGRQYAEEMAAQSPFETVEMRWSEAGKLMEQRNRVFLQAKSRHEEATLQKPEVNQLTGEVRRAVTTSVGGVLSPGALIEAMRNPAVQVPKQLATLGGIKDVPHSVSQTAWQDAAASVDAELAMRRERVKLHQLLRAGELIERELAIVRSAPAPAEDADPADAAAIREWRVELAAEREQWLGEIRDLFDAEYHDVRFKRDRSGLPTYAEVDEPDLTDWERWCRLAREKELIETLSKAHEERKPAVPGTTMIADRLGGIVRMEKAEEESGVRESGAVRREVRTLVQSWRKMKKAQKEAAAGEARHTPPVITGAAEVNQRRKIFKDRSTEIESVGLIWMMDEKCWE